MASALPVNFPATVLVVMHVASTARSLLPQILQRVTALTVAHASDEAELHPGRILIAPPDRHLLVADGRVVLSRGPRENGHRPAVDALFRSAAEQYGPACCGVILSGTRDDGAIGLAEVKAAGGMAIVQDPTDAMYDSMPASAMAVTEVDEVLPADRIGLALVALARSGTPVPAADDGQAEPVPSPELLTILCPECGGSLFEEDERGFPYFRCHIGHRYSMRSLLAAHAEGVERAMWAAARTLEDRAALLSRMARRARASGSITSAERFEHQALTAVEQVGHLRAAISALDDASTEQLASPEGGAA